MPSYRHYCYQTPFGFQTCDTQVDPPPEEYIERWGVNLAESDLIDAGAKVEVIDDELVITPNPKPPPPPEAV